MKPSFSSPSRRRPSTWLIVLFLSLTARSAVAQGVNAFTYASEPTDYIGKGASGFYPSDKITSFNFGQIGNQGVIFYLTVTDPALGSVFWSLRFSAPTGQSLTTGDYVDATDSATPTRPALDVAGNNRSSSVSGGRFSVKEVSYDAQGALTSFRGTFEQHLGGSPASLVGEIWFHANGPLAVKSQLVRVPFGQPLQFAFDAGSGATNFSATGLPAGLSINSASGLIFGTPSEYGHFSAEVTASASGSIGSGLLSLVILDPPNATSFSAVSDLGDFIGKGKTYYLSTSDGDFSGTKYPDNTVELRYYGNDSVGDQWSFRFGPPSGQPLVPGVYNGAIKYITLDPVHPTMDVSGNGSGSNTLSGYFRVNELSTSANGTLRSFSATFEQHSENMTPALRGTIRLNTQLRITSANSASGSRGNAFSYQVVANDQPTSYTATGLPSGLSISASTGLISGVPTQSGYFQVEISAVGAGGTATMALTLAVGPLPPKIVSANAANGAASQPFFFPLEILNNPINVTVAGLPLGLAYDTGQHDIAGIPRESGTFYGSITATNQTGSDTEPFTVTVAPQQQILTNLSTRLKVQTGDNLMIGGFIIEGPVPKQVFVRGIGPSLAPYNVPDFLADPVLEIRDVNGQLVASNDNWQNQSGGEDVALAIYQHGLAPISPLESVVMVTLPPGPYTALLRGKNGGTGVGLVEVYDSQWDSSRLVNISTRGRVETGDNVMIGGFIVSEFQSVRAVIRVAGPSLAPFGLSPGELLQDPTLEIYNLAGQLIASSDNWRDGDEAGIAATPYAPSDDREPAVILTLPPGEYTAIARGKNGTAGIALIEVYRLSN